MELNAKEKLKAIEYYESLKEKNSEWFDEIVEKASKQEKDIPIDFYLKLYTETKNEIQKLKSCNLDEGKKIEMFELEQKANYICYILTDFMTTRDYIIDHNEMFIKDTNPHKTVYV